jgi:hypothetical protein
MYRSVFDIFTTNFFFLLFTCAYKAWVISPPCPHPLPYHPLRPLPLPPPPQYPAETIFNKLLNEHILRRLILPQKLGGVGK